MATWQALFLATDLPGGHLHKTKIIFSIAHAEGVGGVGPAASHRSQRSGSVATPRLQMTTPVDGSLSGGRPTSPIVS